jgi:hypothetical protein
VTVTNGYISVDRAVDYVGQNASRSVETLESVIESASRLIDNYCGQHFWQTAANTSRVFAAEPFGQYLAFGPFNTLCTGTSATIKTDPNGDGTYPTTLASTAYVLEPQNWDGAEVTPYTSVRLLIANYWPYAYNGRRYNVQITGQWGWDAVPAAVKQACLYLVNEGAKLQDAPLGIAGGADFGVAYTKTNMPSRVADLLAPYRHGQNFGLA